MRFSARLAVALFFGAVALPAQTTQGLISGRILNSVTGRPVAGGSVAYSGTTLAAKGTVKSDQQGYYFLPLLSAGSYTIRTTADSYQPQELQQLELPVAGRLNIDFRLRPLNDVWEAGQYRSVFLPGTKTIVTFFGPDVDTSRSGSFEAQKGSRGTLDTSASYVVDPNQIADLPLLGRDVYTMLVSLPGVAADSATGRGLGISVAGQRPSASNYLLDGVENDNHLITGPLSRVAPESVQEYRISTNNYSAEYGRTAGFVANAVTRAGGGDYHGILYEYLKNDALNATDFADNLTGTRKRPMKEHEYGYQAGGPVIPRGALRSRLFFSSSFDALTSHSRKADEYYLLPTTNINSLADATRTSIGLQLIQKYAHPVIQSKAPLALLKMAAPVEVSRLTSLQRGDYITKSGGDHISVRYALARLTQPYFIWTPYPDFISPLHQNTSGVAGNWQRNWSPRLTSEVKVSYSDDNLWWDRAHPEIPTLLSSDAATIPGQRFLTTFTTSLPGSPLLYAYRNHNRSIEIIDSNVLTRNRHVLTWGGGFVVRLNDGYLTAGRDSEYIFDGISSFARDTPYQFSTAVDRASVKPVAPPFDRQYRYNNAFIFFQDSYKLSKRLNLNFGLRYERFAAPANTGTAKDSILQLGKGSSFDEQLAHANLVTPSSGKQQLFDTDNRNFAPRAGFSWDPFGKSNTIIRGGFGFFYDRPFDNLWQNIRANRYHIPIYFLDEVPTDYLKSVTAPIQKYEPLTDDFPGLTIFAPKLKNGFARSGFLGVQQLIGDSFTVEVNFTSSQSRRLITTDVVNRQFTTLEGIGRPLPNYPNISRRTAQGEGDYLSMGALLRYRSRSLQLQGAYTLSHSIDNQSDPLNGDFFDLNFTSIGSAGSNTLRAAFAQQHNPAGDRANSSFDQRHNFFALGVWSAPSQWKLTRGWKVSGMAAFRAGTPYTVFATSTEPLNGGGVIFNQRADLIDPARAIFPEAAPAPGGIYVLNPAAFRQPDSGPGTSGRNAFRGPGLYNADLSLSRTFRVPQFWRLRENALMTFRGDAFNVLNHANLGNPGNLLGDPTFGISTYGRQGAPSGFPAISPLNDAARTFQILLRLQF